MPIYLGNKRIQEITLGSTKIGSVYLGNTLVFQSWKEQFSYTVFSNTPDPTQQGWTHYGNDPTQIVANQYWYMLSNANTCYYERALNLSGISEIQLDWEAYTAGGINNNFYIRAWGKDWQIRLQFNNGGTMATPIGNLTFPGVQQWGNYSLIVNNEKQEAKLYGNGTLVRTIPYSRNSSTSAINVIRWGCDNGYSNGDKMYVRTVNVKTR